MDLLLIPILLALGGGLIYLSLHGTPKVSFQNMPLGFKRDPFNLNQWVGQNSSSRRRGKRVSAEDAELVDLMNDMIAVREQLTDLRLARAPRPIRRRQGRKPATTTTPVVKVELSVAVEEPVELPPAAVVQIVEEPVPVVEKPARASSKLPQPVKADDELPALPKDLLKKTTTPAKAAEKRAVVAKSQPEERETQQRRPAYSAHNRRYVRT